MEFAPFQPDLSKWDAWRPEEVRRRLAGVAAPWWIVGGWAIDLFVGEQRREHDDLEVSVSREGFGQVVQALNGFELFVVGSGRAWPLSEEAMEQHHQTWVREPATGIWRLDVFRETTIADEWVYRRDPRIRMPLADVIERTSDGIPYGRPEIALLYKAKATRRKDDDDLEVVLPKLAAERRRWLAHALALVHPGHRWLAVLSVT